MRLKGHCSWSVEWYAGNENQSYVSVVSVDIIVEVFETNANNTKRISLVKVSCDRCVWLEEVTLGP